MDARRPWLCSAIGYTGIALIVAVVYGCQRSAEPVRTVRRPPSTGPGPAASPAAKSPAGGQLAPEGPRQASPPLAVKQSPPTRPQPEAGSPLSAQLETAPAYAAQSAAEEPSQAPPAGEANNPHDLPEKPPVDPIRANGPHFVGWTRPRLLLVFSGQMKGYLEPCGCAGLENMKGGLARRYSFLQQLRKKGWNVLPLDSGGQVRRLGKQAQMKFHYTIDALRAMGYVAVGLGPQDLRLGAEELLPAVADEQNHLLCANLELLGLPVTPLRVIEAGGLKVGVTAVLGKAFHEQLAGESIKLADPAQALARVVPRLQQQECDLLVLLAHAPPEETRALARRFPQFHLVVTAQGAEEPPAEAEKLNRGKTWLLQTGYKGMYLIAVGVEGPQADSWRYQRVVVDARFPNAPQIDQRMADYQQQLQDLGWSGLGLRPLPHPSGAKFVGSQTCADCHTTACDIWAKTPHAHATRTLARLNPPRQFDPECISCHATGWDPQRYVPFESGYVSMEKTPHLRANGCENCHGPGSRHVAIEQGDLEVSDAEVHKARQAMRVTIQEAKQRTCLQCHDLDNSPDYIKHGFELYWPPIEHKGTD